MNSRTADLAPTLALLPDAVAMKHLTRGVLSGQEEPPPVALTRAAQAVGNEGARWATAPLRELFDEAVRRHAEVGRTHADAWLAPRLHATLRLTRAEAADSALWNFIALVVAPDYVAWRHASAQGAKSDRATITADRFCGPHYKQTFARLWWAAELFRDGDDYGPAVTACRNQDVLNTVLRLDVIDHRPTARALVELMEQGVVRTGRDVNGLASAVNAAGSTLMYDVLAPDDGTDAEALAYWIGERDMAPPTPWETLPDGPDDGPVPRHSVEVLARQFEKLFIEAPIRGVRNGFDPPQS
jgi:hypothetical protein